MSPKNRSTRERGVANGAKIMSAKSKSIQVIYLVVALNEELLRKTSLLTKFGYKAVAVKIAQLEILDYPPLAADLDEAKASWNGAKPQQNPLRQHSRNR